MDKKIETILNEQLNKEFWSGYLYLSMCGYFEFKNLQGFANWMRVQYQEELTHAMKFFDFICERGGKVSLLPIDPVKTKWKDHIEIFEETLKHEKYVTSCINEIVNTSMECKDFATHNFLQWYIEEQVEEEANASLILDQLKMIGDDKNALLMMDRELGTRVFVDTTKPTA